MKYSRILSVAVFALLMVVLASCTVMSDTSGEYGDGNSRRRVYYEDPRYGNTIILERDPYTGQLYEISPYSNFSPFGAYGYGNGNRYYNRYNNGYPYNNRGRVYNGNGRGNTTPSKPSTPSPQTRKNFDDARSKVLGGKRQ